MSALYHELKVLLTMPPHPNIVQKPLYLVTSYCPVHDEHRVCGFILKYYKLGALQELLPQRMLDGSLNQHDQINWAKDVTSALRHISSAFRQFYSDLKMDNILVVSEDGRERAILVDFEQGRNLYIWAPPEIYYVEWIAELGSKDISRSDDLSAETIDKYSAILDRHLSSRGYSLPLQTPGPIYENPLHGWYYPWLISTAQEREAGEIYSLGKVLWCIFEGVGDACNVLGRSIAFESEQQFPEFRRTPESLRELIRRCTAGAREWKDNPIELVRVGETVYPRGKTGRHGEPKATAGETLQAIKAFWQDEMLKAEKFVEARLRYDKGEAYPEDMTWLDYLQRPTLEEVAQALESFST